MNSPKLILEFIIKEKAQGNTFQELTIQMRIMMKGINVKAILNGEMSDDATIINKLKDIAKEFDVNLSKMEINN